MAARGMALARPLPQRGWATRQPSRAPVAAFQAPRLSMCSTKEGAAAAAVLLDSVVAAAALPEHTAGSSGGGAAASRTEPQSLGAPPAAATSPTENTWQLVYSSGGGDSGTPALVRPQRRPTAAPGTVESKPGADPRLVLLTQQLIAASTQADMAATLERADLSAADTRRLLTYLDRQGAAHVAVAVFHALRAARKLGADDALLRTKLIKMHSRRPKDTPVALRLYDEMRADGVVHDAVCYNTCLTAAGLGKHWDRVLSTLDDMAAAGVPWDAYTASALLSACQACGRWQQALEWFQRAREVPGLQLNVVHYTTLMSCLQKAGQWEQSVAVFREMATAGIVPDVVAHNAAIAACARGGDWEAAWAVFLAMKQAGLRPSTVSFNVLISACERGGQPDRALEVFAGMQRAGQPPNAVTYNTLISACAKAGLYARAQRLHAEMQAAGIPDDVFTLTALITACERIGHWQGAEEHFLEFQERGVYPNTVAYNRLISALGRGGQWERAIVAFNAMQGCNGSNRGLDSGCATVGGSSNPSSSSSSSTASASASAGSVDSRAGSRRRHGTHAGSPQAADPTAGSGEVPPGPSAEELYRSSATAKPDRITYGSLLAALERGGQWERALGVFEEMQARGIQPNGYIFTSLINACEKGGQWEEAVRLFKLMQQRQDIPLGSMAMVARKALYAFPSLIRLMPAPLLQAARATVDSGRAARQWIDRRRQEEKSAK